MEAKASTSGVAAGRVATPRRIRIVGTSGSGKTTLARHVSQRTGLAHVELDALYHGPGWSEPAPGEFHQAVDVRLAEAPDGWVMCGNYLTQAPLDAWPVDVVAWIDLPRWRVMARVVRRTVGRVLVRRELWNGNRESVRGLWSADGIVRWAWKTHEVNRRRYEARIAQDDLLWVRLRSQADVDAWLESLGAQ